MCKLTEIQNFCVSLQNSVYKFKIIIINNNVNKNRNYENSL